MGIRVNTAVGYGILLTEEEKNKYSDDKISEKFEEYIEKQRKIVEDANKNKTGFLGNKNIMTAMTLTNLRNEEEENFIYPKMEFGTKRFFGYTIQNRYDDHMDYAMLSILGINGDGNEFEMHPPQYTPEIKNRLNDEGFFVKDTEIDVQIPYFYTYEMFNKNKKGGFDPSAVLLMQIFNDYDHTHYAKSDNEKGREKREIAERLISFKSMKTKEEGIANAKKIYEDYHITILPQNDDFFFYMYELVHDIVKIFYDVPLDRIKKYVVFYFS